MPADSVTQAFLKELSTQLGSFKDSKGNTVQYFQSTEAQYKNAGLYSGNSEVSTPTMKYAAFNTLLNNPDLLSSDPAKKANAEATVAMLLMSGSAGSGKSVNGTTKPTSGSKPTVTEGAKEVNAMTAEEYVNILSPADRQHILFGDAPGSGGHMYPGQSGKTTFPQSWTEGQILHNIGDVVTSPATQWYAQTGTGGVVTKAGDPARWVAWETRDGVSIRVVYEPATGRTVTAFPDSAPATINLNPIKK